MRPLKLGIAALTAVLLGGCYNIIDDTEPGGPTFSFEEVAGPVVVAGDDVGAVVTAPFNLRLFFGDGSYQVDQPDLLASTNGYLLTDTGGDATATDTACEPDPLLISGGRFEVYLDDLTTEVRTETRGSAPEREFVVEWNGEHEATGDGVRFQAVFFEDSDNVLYLYSRVDSTRGGSATVGATWNASGGFVTEVDSYSCNEPGAIRSDRAVQLYYEEPDEVTEPPSGGVRISATTPSAVEGGAPGAFTFTRSGDVSEALTVGYGASGSAVAGEDYEPFGLVRFNPGQSVVTKEVVAAADGVAEGDETVIVTLFDGDDYDVAPPISATVTISDPAPEPEPVDPCEGLDDPAFTDVPASNVHAANIDCLAALGYAQGGPGGLPSDQYGPRLQTTRGQMASFVARIAEDLGVALPAEPADAFDDDDASVHELRIDQLAAVGIIGDNGEDGRSYRPGDTITREEMASFLNRLVEAVAGAPLSSDEDAFTDDEESPYQADINGLAAAGIVEGTGGGLYDPEGTVQRDSMASFLTRTIQHLANES